MLCTQKTCFIFNSPTFHIILLPIILNSSLHEPEGENSLGLGGSKTGFQLGEEKIRFLSMRKRRGQKGTRLPPYLFCLFAINDPTLLHSWSEISYLTLSWANWPPNSTNGPQPFQNSESRSDTKAPPPNFCLQSPQLARPSLGPQTNQKHWYSTPGFATVWP